MRLRGATSAAAAKTTTITRTPFLACDGGEVVVATASGRWRRDTPVRRRRRWWRASASSGGLRTANVGSACEYAVPARSVAKCLITRWSLCRGVQCVVPCASRSAATAGARHYRQRSPTTIVFSFFFLFAPFAALSYTSERAADTPLRNDRPRRTVLHRCTTGDAFLCTSLALTV